jgi:hypothetical protein
MFLLVLLGPSNDHTLFKSWSNDLDTNRRASSIANHSDRMCTSLANEFAACTGEAVGQTFVAPRGDLRSVTVWRYAVQESLAFGIHLLVCSVDSLDAPHPEQILLDGPTLHEYGDGIHHTPFQYILDPPLHLASGSYCIFFKVDPCDAWSDLLTTNRGAYASGSEWRTSRNLLNCALRPSPNQHPDWDLVFSVDVDTTGVEVTAFSAVFADSGAVVQWSAANTRCVSTFRIERSEGNCGDYQPGGGCGALTGQHRAIHLD